MIEDRIYKSAELYVADYIEVTGRCFVLMERNNNQPWKEFKIVGENHNNIYVKLDETHYQQVSTGKIHKVFGDEWGEGDRGIDKILPFDYKMSLAYKILNVESLELSVDEIKILEKDFRQIPTSRDSGFMEALEKFLNSRDTEKE